MIIIPICTRIYCSIPVSAKSKDGSVDEAFKAVIKHLLDKSKRFWPKVHDEKISQTRKTKKVKKQHPEFELHFENLTLTGITEVCAFLLFLCLDSF